MTAFKVALDTNVLVYAEGLNGDERRRIVLDCLQRLPPELIVLPVQTLGELFNVLVKKAGRSPNKAREAILSWRDSFELVETSTKVMIAASDIAAQHKLSIWDAVVLAAASEAGGRLVLSEDMQNGFTWAGVTVVNPFADPRHALLIAMLEE